MDNLIYFSECDNCGDFSDSGSRICEICAIEPSSPVPENYETVPLELSDQYKEIGSLLDSKILKRNHDDLSLREEHQLRVLKNTTCLGIR